MKRVKKLIFSSINKTIREVQDIIGAVSILNYREYKVHTTHCKKEDLPEILKIYKDNFGGGAEKTISKYQKKFQNVFFVINNDDSNIIGYCTYYIHIKIKNWSIQKIATIYSFAVDDMYVGEGVGTSLLKESINELKENNIEIIRLYVKVDNRPAMHLYKKFGFIEMDICENICGQGSKCYRMELLLDTVNGFPK